MKYEIRPVKLVSDNYEQCGPDDPEAVWGVYEVGADGLPLHKQDYATRAEAEAVCRKANEDPND